MMSTVHGISIYIPASDYDKIPNTIKELQEFYNDYNTTKLTAKYNAQKEYYHTHYEMKWYNKLTKWLQL